MKNDIVFLSVEQVVLIHERMIRDFGGAPDIRDQGLLESAVSAPIATFGGVFLHDSIASMAAAYLFNICKNHAFVDGNKRTAFTTSTMFLALNGFFLDAPQDELERITLGVADSSISKPELIEILESIIKPIRN